MHTKLQKYTLVTLLLFCFSASAEQIVTGDNNLIKVHQLQYLEREPGVDAYGVTMLVSGDKIRVDETGEDSGYIIYDDVKKIIYSISHLDDSILVINEHTFSNKNSPAKAQIHYQQLEDAPSVNGKKVFNYRVYSGEGNAEETCMDIQLVENLLPKVQALLKRYQNVISGQQVKMTNNEITEVQTACYFSDQIYNAGAYYDKGMPIQEWHSNERFKQLQSFNEITVKPELFDVPENYHRFSIDKDSKTFIN